MRWLWGNWLVGRADPIAGVWCQIGSNFTQILTKTDPALAELLETFRWSYLPTTVITESLTFASLPWDYKDAANVACQISNIWDAKTHDEGTTKQISQCSDCVQDVSTSQIKHWLRSNSSAFIIVASLQLTWANKSDQCTAASWEMIPGWPLPAPCTLAITSDASADNNGSGSNKSRRRVMHAFCSLCLIIIIRS